MTTEAQLREALGGMARGALHEPGSFESVRARAGDLRRRRRQRRLVMATAAAIAIAAAAGAVQLTGEDRVTVATDPTTPTTRSGALELLVATRSGTVSVWRDGVEQRRVATRVAGVTELAVTPDGGTALVVHETTDPARDGCATELAGIDLREGASTPTLLVGGAQKPMISPDGGRVAYWLCDEGVGLTSLLTGENHRLTGWPARPLAWTGEKTLAWALVEPTPDGGEGWATMQSTFDGRGWPDGTRVDLHVGYPVAQPWVASGTDAVFGVGSRLDSNREAGDLPPPIRDFGRDGAQGVVAIAQIVPGDLHALLVTTEGADGARRVWRVDLDDELGLIDLVELPVPPDVAAVAPFTPRR